MADTQSNLITPPRYPTYGVHFTKEEISALLINAIPGSFLKTVTPLQHGKSFNNRLYYLNLDLSQGHRAKDSSPSNNTDLVLKVNGHCFGPSKIQNEVACLCLLQETLLDSPTPRVIAWSDDGIAINRLVSTKAKTFEVVNSPDITTKHGWILMTKLPGQPISFDKLSQEDLEHLGNQLANIVSTWRQDLMVSDYCGNISILNNDNGETAFKTISSPLSELSLAIGTSILGNGLELSSLVPSLYEYFRLKLIGRLDKLKTLETLKANRHLGSKVSLFIQEILPQLQIFTGHSDLRDKFIFTHNDLSHRNVLVAGNPPKITGIVDFEFSGFFSEMDEFLVEEFSTAGPLSSTFHAIFLSHLEMLGVATPLQGFDKKIWEQANQLTNLEEHIAPWWLEQGGLEPEKLEEQMQKAEKAVIDALAALQSSL